MAAPVMVTLTDQEAYAAAQLGCKRNIRSVYRGGRHRAGWVGPAWNNAVLGAMAEAAVRKHFGLPLDPTHVDVYTNQPDVPVFGGLEVRWSGQSRLIIRPEDKPGAYLLVTGDAPEFALWGVGMQADAVVKPLVVLAAGRPGVHVLQANELQPVNDWAAAQEGTGVIE